MRWVVIGGDFNEERYRFLSQFLSTQKIANELTIQECSPEEFPAIFSKAQLDFDQIRIERPFCEKVIKKLKQTSTETLLMRSADTFLKKTGGMWWPKSCLYDGVAQLAAERLKNLDLNASIFIVGTGASARSVIAAFVRLGFKRINVADRFAEKAQSFVQDLRTHFFGIKFEFTILENLTLLPGNHQVVVNTTPLLESNTILEELYYFNYLTEAGIVIDLTLVPVETPLLREAKSVKADAIPGYLVAAYTDRVWVESVSGCLINIQNYSSELEATLQKIEFDVQPFFDRMQ